MAIRTVYAIRRGQTASFFIEAVTGDPTTAWAAICKVKPITNRTVPAPDGTVEAVLTLTPVPTGAAPPIGPGWMITITAAQTAALNAGFYIADFACTLAGGEIVTAPVVFEVDNAISAP